MEDNTSLIDNLKLEQEQIKNQNLQMSNALASSSFQGSDQGNLVEYQLETAELLNKLEHFLRGEYIKTDEVGNEFWAKQKDEKLILLNDYGISMIMSIIGSYVDKGTALSTYDEMRINEILGDLGDELAIWIFCNYEIIGMNTDFKKTRFSLLVLNILHIIESSYRKALGGQMREDINTSKIFTQSDFLGRSPIAPAMNKKKFNLFKTSTW